MIVRIQFIQTHDKWKQIIIQIMIGYITEQDSMLDQKPPTDPEERENASRSMQESLSTTHSIKQFLGEYLARCKPNKYKVVQIIMNEVVFDGKPIRRSYLRDVLQAEKDAIARNRNYMISCEEKFQQILEDLSVRTM